MAEIKRPLSPQKQILFWCCLVIIVVMIPFIFATGYFAYKKINYSFEFGEKFGQFDDELGWTLKKNSSSYIRGKSLITGKTYFDSTVYTDELGFRSQSPGTQHVPEGIVAIGDSWTFGYCVDYEESYPYFLEKLSNIPVTNLGVPAYGSGSTYGLFKRHVSKLQPKLVVYFTIGLWERSLSTTYPPTPTNNHLNLIPYFYYDKEMDRGQIKFPNPGVVSKSVDEGYYPGGSLTAGYNTYNYFLHVKIPQILSLAKSYLPKYPTSKDAETNEEFEKYKLNKILKYEVELYGKLSALHQFKLLIIDVTDAYSSVVENFNKDHPNQKIMFIGNKEFTEKVYTKGINIGLSPDEIRVPMDGHFGPGTNKLIAEMIMGKINNTGIDLQ